MLPSLSIDRSMVGFCLFVYGSVYGRFQVCPMSEGINRHRLSFGAESIVSDGGLTGESLAFSALGQVCLVMTGFVWTRSWMCL